MLVFVSGEALDRKLIMDQLSVTPFVNFGTSYISLYNFDIEAVCLQNGFDMKDNFWKGIQLWEMKKRSLDHAILKAENFKTHVDIVNGSLLDVYAVRVSENMEYDVPDWFHLYSDDNRQSWWHAGGLETRPKKRVVHFVSSANNWQLYSDLRVKHSSQVGDGIDIQYLAKHLTVKEKAAKIAEYIKMHMITFPGIRQIGGNKASEST